MNKEEIIKKIIIENKDLFKENINYNFIDSGFNNTIFDINNKYIVKINNNDLKSFEKEIKFYQENYNKLYIPKLYKYDLSKTNVPVYYQIIEKINGKTLYYYWHDMNEFEREEIIKKLVTVLKDIHIESSQYDFSSYIKEKIMKCLNIVSNYFKESEYNIILKSLNYYDLILKDNKFCLIHNDLHFDNIFKDQNNNIKLIDFNDMMIAPFDFEFRIFYMMQDRPFKWASLETEKFQKREDYINLFTYVKKYYQELNELKYLDFRMLIYEVLNDIQLLCRFNETELKERIIEDSFKIVNYFEKSS